MKSTYIERAQVFIQQFFCDLTNTPLRNLTTNDIEFYVSWYNKLHHRSIEFHYGMSRYAFVTSDYVVKIDYKELSRSGTCKSEYVIYQRIKNEKFAYLFAEITPYEFNGWTFYIMPRVHNIDGNRDEWATEFMTEEEYEYVCETLDLGDLHSDNYGFKNGKVIIFDYACY